MIVLKCVSRAARNRIRNAPITATIANSSGITVGTSARNSTIRITNRREQPDEVADSLRRRRALRLAGELDLDPGRRADRAQLILDRDDAGAWKLEAGAVVLHVEERDLAVVGELVGVRESGS